MLKTIIDNKSLAIEGEKRMTWFRDRMPVVADINDYFRENKTFKDKVIAICMHIEPKTAFWIEGLLQGGAKHIYLIGCIGTTNPDTCVCQSKSLAKGPRKV
jgi:adenosylhomocysteinase